MADQDSLKISETAQPILPQIINHGDRDAFINNFRNDGTFIDGSEAKEYLLKTLREQRELFAESDANNYVIKAMLSQVYDSAIQNLEKVDEHGLDGSNGSENSQYILSIATAYNHFSEGKPQFIDGKILEHRTILFNPEEIQNILVSGQSRETTPALESGRNAIMQELGHSVEFPSGPELPDPTNIGGLSTRNRDANKTTEPKEVDDRDAISKAADNIDKALESGGGIAGMIARKKAKEALEQQQGEGELGDLESPSNPNAQERSQEDGRGQ